MHRQIRKASGLEDIDTLVAALTLAKSLRALSSFSARLGLYYEKSYPSR